MQMTPEEIKKHREQLKEGLLKVQDKTRWCGTPKALAKYYQEKAKEKNSIKK